MKTIRDYHSFRDFLKDVFLEEKNSSKRVTLNEYASKFGLSGPTLNMIFSGARNLTIGNLHEISRVLKFSTSDREYFEALVLKDQAEDKETKSYYSRRLKEISRKTKVKSIRVSDKRILSNWIVPALLIYLIDFENIKSGENLKELDFNLIAKKFSLTPSEVQSFIRIFQQMEMLTIDKDDSVHIYFDKLTHHFPQKEYIKAVLTELAQRIDSDFENKQTLFRGLTFSIEKSQVSNLRRELLDVFEKYMAKNSENKDENIIIQALVGLFPVLTQPK